MYTRRNFLGAGAALAASALIPGWARSALADPRVAMRGIRPLSGNEYRLEIARTPVAIEGRRGEAVTINGQLPAPLLRWREGEEVTLHVTNRLDETTSIHWHGILVPPTMDGVPGVAFPGIAPGETFTYRFRVRQTGTYWYHSHSGFQEQLGHYGPLIIDPAGPDPIAYDREYVLVLSDWTFLSPEWVFAKLKKNSDGDNFQKRTIADFFRDMKQRGLGDTIAERLMWGRMRMDPTDLADVTGHTYRYLINGHGLADNWTALFRPGERVRLRIINAAAMTIFNFRIPSLPMTVVQADGQNVEPVTVDEFQIGVAETYDVIVTPRADRAFAIVAESIDRSGLVRATLAPRPGMEAEVPPLRPRPLLGMKDMGMGDMHDMSGMKMDGMKMGGMKTAHAMPAEKDGGMSAHHGQHGMSDHSGMAMHDGASDRGMDMPAAGPVRHDHPKGVGVVNIARNPVNRLGEPGTGLENVGHRVLTYRDLKSVEPTKDRREPEREIFLHLTGNMERYMWSFDGRKFSEGAEPIVLHYGERVRLTLVNDTMMPHPIHLHGMFFELVNGHHPRQPRKHTVIVKPGEILSFDVTADEAGDWAFHCHLLYHMAAGMFRVVSVRRKA